MFETLPQGVTLNPDRGIVDALVKAMEKNGGYCPCRLKHVPETMCPCKEFREQLADASFSGYCHCHLYKKEKETEGE